MATTASRVFLTLAVMMMVVALMWILGVSIASAPTAQWAVEQITERLWR